ncbi:hypothetical protein FAZ78_00305 [Cereibacter changlensis]|uniref:Uncharacterized protein n=1 Tax=Cereibacter changlensis TaxID=402884 RepID=A0A4U0Z7L2_9RHOB|nr:hypothetical protein [Cereibacter changlensis]TKA98534.1 hypothetical protein FAZ78_00305 [Cereibacter changlensis]
MTIQNPISGNDTGLLSAISDCQYKAVMLHALCQGADFIFDGVTTEVSPAANSMTGLLHTIVKAASELASDLDRIHMGKSA